MHLLGEERRIRIEEGISAAAYAIGATIALCFLVWMVLKLRSLYCEDEEDTGGNAEFLSLLNESKAEGDVTPEEIRSIQRRWLEQQMGVGDSSQATPAKTAGHRRPTLTASQDDTEETTP
ncbi:MAG: hypothetical protein DWH91_06060 [Planctomycetota bacterium]|nr:MAG: hypothetical protein DWH91_06060 [Planctomycetota bacterium]